MQLRAHPRLCLQHGFDAEDIINPMVSERLAIVERVEAIPSSSRGVADLI